MFFILAHDKIVSLKKQTLEHTQPVSAPIDEIRYIVSSEKRASFSAG